MLSLRSFRLFRFPRLVTSHPLLRSFLRSPTTSSTSRALFQRVPPLLQLIVLGLALYGPHHLPYTFSFLTLFVHATFVFSNARTALGMRNACKKVQESAEMDWRSDSGDVEEFDQVKHLVIVPNYKESMDTLRSTLRNLASHPSSSKQYIVCLAFELSETDVQTKSNKLHHEFSAVNGVDAPFFRVVSTFHPRGIPGESAGKGSNVSFAARDCFARGFGGDLITVMDADTAFAADWFDCAASKYTCASLAERENLMFVAPIIFNRNANDVAAPVACTDILWSAAGVGTMLDGSCAKLPTSAYAMSTRLAYRLGWWDAGPDAIGEDLHMAVKAFFETSGKVIVHPIFSPASQCNVIGFRFDKAEGERVTLYEGLYQWASDLVARYSQAKRHMWGALDTGYALRRLLMGSHGLGSDLPPLRSADIEHVALADLDSALKDAEEADFEFNRSETASTVMTPFSDRDDPLFDYVRGSNDPSRTPSPPSSRGSPVLSPAKVLGLEVSDRFKLNSLTKTDSLPTQNLLVLLSRLYEAHCNLGFLFMLLTVAPFFNRGLEPIPLWKLRPAAVGGVETVLPKVVLISTAISSHLGTLAFICTASIFFYYEQYHYITTTKRWEGRPHLGAKPESESLRRFPTAALTYAGLPFTVFFGILPLYHALICHIFTDKLTYQVSLKPKSATQASKIEV